MVATLQSPIVRIQRANPDGAQTRPTTPDWRRFTAVFSQPEPRSGGGPTASERSPCKSRRAVRLTGAAYLPPRGFEELENAVGGDGGPVRTVAELVSQLVARLLELEDGADSRQLLRRGGYEAQGAIFDRGLIALEEGMARQSLPRHQAPKRLSAFLRRTSSRRRVRCIAQGAQHAGDIANGWILPGALLEGRAGSPSKSSTTKPSVVLRTWPR